MKLDSMRLTENIKNSIDKVSNNYNPDKMLEKNKFESSFDKVGKETKKYNPDRMIENNYEKVESNGVKNKEEGCKREDIVENKLKEIYNEKDGYNIEREQYLRDENGNIVKDPQKNEARRLDFVVFKGDKIVDMVEVTSLTADKTNQIAKEQRIREVGGNYIKNFNGNLVKIPNNMNTRIERVNLEEY